MSKNRSNVEKHPFDLFFANSLKISEFLSEDQGLLVLTSRKIFEWQKLAR